MRLLLGDAAYGNLTPQVLAEHVTATMLGGTEGARPGVGTEECVG